MFMTYERQIDELLKKMSLKEKIGQLNMMLRPGDEKTLEEYKEKIRRGEVGSIIMTSGDGVHKAEMEIKAEMEMYDELQRVAVEESPHHIPLLYGLDVIHGHHTVYPIPLASTAAFNEELVEKCYGNIAREAAAEGVHWTFSPMLDLGRDPRWGRMVEGPGEDPVVGASLARACVKGFQGSDFSDPDRLVACAKHYIGYGASEGGRDYHRTEITDYSLYNYYLPAFRAAVEAGVGTVMSSFNDISGQPVTSSRKYLTDILRGELGFEGFVVSDWAAIEQLQMQGVSEDRADCAEKAILAGLDMDMCDLCYNDHLEELVRSGRVPEEAIDLAARRVLRIKFAKGLMKHPYCEHKKIDRTKHLSDARKLAAESMVLLKNDGVLPLKKDCRIALIGPYVQERRSLLGAAMLDYYILEETPTLLEAMSAKIGEEHILRSRDESGLTDNSVHAPLVSDVVVLALGESWQRTGEAHSVSDIALAPEQVELVKRVKSTGKKVVGVFFCGRPVALEGVAEYLDAVLYAWHSGTETANAVCDILFGDVVPSGKTAVTFPRRTGHIPMYYNVTSSGRKVNGYYGEQDILTYEDSVAGPYYPFGYGLSYTTFAYDKPIAEFAAVSLEELEQGKKVHFSVDVTNTGKYDGKETVQLYIRDMTASMMRPMRELKKFKKVFIKQGETATVDFALGQEDLGFYTAQGEYVVESGKFLIYIGENCLTENKVDFQIVDAGRLK